jgi:NAD(P)H-flavin reductase
MTVTVSHTTNLIPHTTATAPMQMQLWQVGRVRQELPQTVTFDLHPIGHQGMSFAPGQFNMLYVFGVGEIAISISGDPARTDVLTHTVRDVGLVSHALCSLRRGDTVGVRGPFGTAWPVEVAAGYDVVIAAGGVGLPPLRPALYHLLAHRAEYGNVVLLYGARTRQDLVYPHEVEGWRGRFDVEVGVTVDSATGGWLGHVGTVTTLIPRAGFDPHHTIAMVCGPEIMIRFTVQELQKRGVSADNIYISMERNMKCAVGLCGHCQLGPFFICKDGPVFRFSAIQDWFGKREV